MEWLTAGRWSPYAVGLGIGILCCFTFMLSDKAIGCTTAYARTSGMIERLFRGARVVERPYFQKFRPEVDWEWMFVVGIVIGSFLSASLSGHQRAEWVPETWAAAFGPSVAGRWLAACAGGVLMGFGSRWAGGCTSGHGISGTLQLALSSWLVTASLFAGGVITALLIY
ncbi:MAG: YeeE/YedE family protein [bacterium]|nr:MAG: YeeE/YedE family protein [bacterium]